MKLREINEAPVNEEGIIGRGIAAAQQLGSKITGGDLSQLSVTDRHAMNIFIKDFLKKVSPALGIAVNSKIVDPTIVDTSSTGGGAIKPTGAPLSQLGKQTQQQMLAQRAASAVPSSGRKPAATAAPAAAVSTAPAAPTAPTVPAAPAAPATPLTDFGSVGAERAKRAKAGEAIPDASLNVGRREPRGIGSLSETQYQKLNSIFESILLNEAKSIPTFLKDFLHANVPQLNTNDPEIAKTINQLTTQVQTDWTKDKGKSALTKLAQSAYILAMLPSSSGTPSAAGAGGQGAQGGRIQGLGAQGGGSGGAAPEIAQYTQNILAQINRMQRNDADDLDAIIINALRRLYKVNSSAYMDTVQHLRTMLQAGAPTTPTPVQGSPAPAGASVKGSPAQVLPAQASPTLLNPPAQKAPNLMIARESKNRARK
jgi:hypothetical protein